MLYRILPRDMFVISVEESIDNAPPSSLCRVLSTHNVNNTKIDLVKWRPVDSASATSVVTVQSESQLSNLTTTWTNLPQGQKLVVISPYPTVPGLKEFVKDMSKYSDCNKIHLIMTSDKETLDHLPELTCNVLKNVK